MLYLFLHRNKKKVQSSFTNRHTFIKTLITNYIKIRWLLHVSVYDTIHTPYWDVLPHHRIPNYDVTLLNVLISI